MWMRPPRRRSRTSWSSTTGPCWSPIHVAASPRSSVDLELVPATRSPTVNSPVHFHNKLEEQRTSCVSFPFTKLYRWFAYSLSSSKGCLHVELKSMAANYSTLATVVGHITKCHAAGRLRISLAMKLRWFFNSMYIYDTDRLAFYFSP